MTTWILVAHRSSASLYEHTRPGELRLVREIEHPAGHLKSHEIVEDRAGRSFDSHSTHRSAVGSDDELPLVDAGVFARALSAMLNAGRVERAYDRLVLVAAPRMLGAIRSTLDAHVASMIIAEVDKDLARGTDADVREQLREIINV